jgi:hypothetical protein
MWNQPCYNVPPNMGNWVFVPTGGSPDPSGKPMTLKKMLRKAMEDKEVLDAYIKDLEKKRKEKKPEENGNGKGLGIIHQSMLLMLTAVPLGVLDLILIRALNN